MHMPEEAAFTTPSTKSRIAWLACAVVCQSVAWLVVMAILIEVVPGSADPLLKRGIAVPQIGHMLLDLSYTARHLWGAVAIVVLMEWCVLGVFRWGNSLRMFWAEIINMFVLAGLIAFLFFVTIVMALNARAMAAVLDRLS